MRNLPPGLSGFVQAEQLRGQQQSQQLQQLGMLAQLQTGQMQQQKLRREMDDDQQIRTAAASLPPGATLADLAKVIAPINPLKAAALMKEAQAGELQRAQIVEHTAKGNDLRLAGQARRGLASLQTPEGSFDSTGFGLTDPSVQPQVMQNDQAAISAARAAMARGENVAANVPNPGNVRALALQANLPQGALAQLLKETGGTEEKGYTLGPGANRYDSRGNLIASAPFAPRNAWDTVRGVNVDLRNNTFAEPVRAGGAAPSRGYMMQDEAGNWVPSSTVPGAAPLPSHISGSTTPSSALPPRPTNSPLVIVQGPDGALRYVPRNQAVGQTPGRVPTAPTDSAQPGGIGSNMFQDPATGAKYSVNTRTGKAWRMQEDGKWVETNPNDVPKNVQKLGNIGAMGARESVFNQRMLSAANQAAKDLSNVAQMPVTISGGWLAGRKQGASLTEAVKEQLALKVTTQDQQIYNTMATGFQRNLAQIESAGLAPPNSLTQQMNQILLQENDTNLTKLSKLAQIRQIIEAGLDTQLSNPRLSESEKAFARKILSDVHKAVPFTQQDVLNLQRDSGQKGQPMQDMMGGRRVAPYSDPEKERRYQEWLKANP